VLTAQTVSVAKGGLPREARGFFALRAQNDRSYYGTE